LELERLMLEKGDCQDSLEKAEHRVNVLEHEKRRLIDDVKRVSDSLDFRNSFFRFSKQIREQIPEKCYGNLLSQSVAVYSCF